MAEILNLLLDSLPWDILDHTHTQTHMHAVSAEGSLAPSVLIDGCVFKLW